MFVSLFNDAVNKSDCISSNVVATVSHMSESDYGLFKVLYPQLPRGILQMFCVLNPCNSLVKTHGPLLRKGFWHLQTIHCFVSYIHYCMQS